MYKLINGFNGILRGTLAIPADPKNADWQQYQQWLADGNTPESADVPWPEPTTAAKVKQAALAAVRPAAVDDTITIDDSVTIGDW